MPLAGVGQDRGRRHAVGGDADVVVGERPPVAVGGDAVAVAADDHHVGDGRSVGAGLVVARRDVAGVGEVEAGEVVDTVVAVEDRPQRQRAGDRERRAHLRERALQRHHRHRERDGVRAGPEVAFLDRRVQRALAAAVGARAVAGVRVVAVAAVVDDEVVRLGGHRQGKEAGYGEEARDGKPVRHGNHPL